MQQPIIIGIIDIGIQIAWKVGSGIKNPKLTNTNPKIIQKLAKQLRIQQWHEQCISKYFIFLYHDDAAEKWIGVQGHNADLVN